MRLVKRLGEGLALHLELTANLAEGAAHAAAADQPVMAIIGLGVLHLPNVSAEPHWVDDSAAVPEGAFLLTGLSKVVRTGAWSAEGTPKADLCVFHAIEQTTGENLGHCRKVM